MSKIFFLTFVFIANSNLIASKQLSSSITLNSNLSTTLTRTPFPPYRKIPKTRNVSHTLFAEVSYEIAIQQLKSSFTLKHGENLLNLPLYRRSVNYETNLEGHLSHNETHADLQLDYFMSDSQQLGLKVGRIFKKFWYYSTKIGTSDSIYFIPSLALKHDYGTFYLAPLFKQKIESQKDQSYQNIERDPFSLSYDLYYLTSEFFNLHLSLGLNKEQKIYNNPKNDHCFYSGTIALVSFIDRSLLGTKSQILSTGLILRKNFLKNRETYDYGFYSANSFRVSQAGFLELKSSFLWKGNQRAPINPTKSIQLSVSYTFNFAKKAYTHREQDYFQNYTLSLTS